MKTKSKSLFIAVAAFAVTASGVHAFGSTELLTRAGLTDEQVIAVQEAQELKATGNISAAKETLEAAGVTSETMKNIREVAKEAKAAVHDAVESGDYDAFMVAVADSPLAEIITTEADFELFVEAHELRESGDKDGARELFEELGVDTKKLHKQHHGKHAHKEAVHELLSDEQREALQVAQAANDREAVQAIFTEVGIELNGRGWHGHRR